MSERISQAFIDDLLGRVDIIDVVDSRVKLKRAGKNYQACCPFHQEKTPSFTVSSDKQFYHCFGCGASGNAIGFVMNYDGLNFPEAVENLAKLVGLTVPKQERSAKAEAADKQRKLIYQVLEQANLFFQTQLRQHESRIHAAKYLKKRGLSTQVVQEFQLGLAPPGWDLLIKHLCDANARLSEKEVIKLALDAGLVVENPENQRRYDRFRDRIMFPIIDVRKRVIGFGGRVLDAGQSDPGKKQPKYLNSPETSVFHKGKELYGLANVRQAYTDIPKLLVVEGYMDVVALAQFGIRYAVATLGTACGEEHLKLAFKYTQEVVFCFDGDKAGRNAAKRALENSLPAMEDGRSVRFLFLPEGEDPDTLVRKVGAQAFENMVAQSVALEEYLYEVAGVGLNLNSLEGKASLSKKMAPLLSLLPEGVYRELMQNQLAQHTGLSRENLDELALLSIPKFAEDTPDLTSDSRLPQDPRVGSAHANAENQRMDNWPDTPEYSPADYESSQYTQYEPKKPKPGKTSSYDKRKDDEQGGHSSGSASKFALQPVRRLLALLVQHPELARQVELTDLLTLDNQTELAQIAELIGLLRERPQLDNAQKVCIAWQARFGESRSKLLAELSATDLLAGSQGRIEYNPSEEFRSCAFQLQNWLGQRKIRHLEDRLYQQALTLEEQKQLSIEILNLKKQLLQSAQAEKLREQNLGTTKH